VVAGEGGDSEARGGVRTRSIVSSSRVISRGADQRLGKGMRAVALDNDPAVIVTGSVGGMRALISCPYQLVVLT
jgi:hypothetical protein